MNSPDQAAERFLTPTELLRFVSKIEVTKPLRCWEWRGTMNTTGYGFFSIQGKQNQAHRVSYKYFVGPIPEGLHLDHLCRNPPCVNPAHLEAVTPGENNRRSNSPSALSMLKTECKNGHPYDEVNTYITAQGWRACRACHRHWKNIRNAALKEQRRLARAARIGN